MTAADTPVTRASALSVAERPEVDAVGGLGLRPESRSRRNKDVIAKVVMWASFALAVIPLAWILWTVVSQGVQLVLASTWWTHSQRNINASDAGAGPSTRSRGPSSKGR